MFIGACSGSGPCSFILGEDSQVTATFGTVPGVPNKLRGTSPQPGRLALTWEAPHDDGDLPIVAYEVSCTRGSNTVSKVVGGTATNLNGLTPGANQCAVVAINAAGEGPARLMSLRVN